MKIQGLTVLLFLIALFATLGCNEINTLKNDEPACNECIHATTACSDVNTSPEGQHSRMFLFMGIITLVLFILWYTSRKKVYLGVIVLLFLIAGGSHYYSAKSYPGFDGLTNNETINNEQLDSLHIENNNGSYSASSEFEDFTAFEEETNTSTFSSEFSSEFSDDFEDFSDQTLNDSDVDNDNTLMYQIIVLLFLTVLIGFTIKYKIVRYFRGIIIISVLVYLGFIKGGCPCIIMSLHNTILYLMGDSMPLTAMLWFLGLIPITYFFGRVWCGWLCHLGGLQEILFRVPKVKWLTTEKSQKVLRYIQIGVFVGLLIQLMLTQTILWKYYDPFKVAFNLISSNTTGYVLLAILLMSSIFIYKPFCNMACPVGLVLSWVTKLPKGRRLTITQACTKCKKCINICKQNALYTDESGVKVRNENCILCGECMDNCKKNALLIKSK